MTKTTNYGLNKPENTEFYDVDIPNENMDIIDAELKKHADHTTNKTNPHGVTKVQVGLGNVENTADMDKPVSTAQQNAIDAVGDVADEALSIAKGRNQSLSYLTYSEMITALNTMASDAMNTGQNMYIGTVGVPDVWVYGVADTASTYTYTDDDAFVNELNTNGTVQVGYYKLAQLETQKVDLTDINAEIAALNAALNGIQFRISDGKLQFRYDTEVYGNA